MPTNPTENAATRRIRALLAKAASTPYGEEAEACIAKAQELMARHAIDDATIRSQLGTPAGDDVVLRVVLVERPYASARTSLLSAIARSNHCRVVLQGATQDGQQCTVIGHVADVEHVDALYAILSVHATRALFDADPGERPKSYRHGFLLAYSTRIGERLRLANETARQQAEHETHTSVSLVLVERWAAVDRAVRREFPFLSRARRTVTSSAGFASGRAAADRAPLAAVRFAGRRGLPGGSS